MAYIVKAGLGACSFLNHFDETTDVEIPNINCSSCILQVVEFMANHGVNKDGDFTHQHIARGACEIHANSSRPIDYAASRQKRSRYPATLGGH